MFEQHNCVFCDKVVVVNTETPEVYSIQCEHVLVPDYYGYSRVPVKKIALKKKKMFEAQFMQIDPQWLENPVTDLIDVDDELEDLF